MADKMYEPEFIPEIPFPGQELTTVQTIQSTAGGNYSPAVSTEKPIPKKRTAIELLSTALNTRSRKILESFELQQSGGFQIGNFQEGITGDVRLTPNGLTARDLAGITTFALDATTGDAIFKGTVQAGTLIGGEVIVGNNRIIIDGENKKIIINDGSNDRVLIGYDPGGF